MATVGWQEGDPDPPALWLADGSFPRVQAQLLVRGLRQSRQEGGLL